MANVIYFFHHRGFVRLFSQLTIFIILRALFGIGMGGEWGVGASLAMEAAPVRWRGILSGICKAAIRSDICCGDGREISLTGVGVASDVLDRRAARATRAVHPEESGRNQKPGSNNRVAKYGQVLRIGGGRMEALRLSRLLMTFMMFLSHGTQDLYPDYLKEVHKISVAMVANIAMIYNAGAVVAQSSLDTSRTEIITTRPPQRPTAESSPATSQRPRYAFAAPATARCVQDDCAHYGTGVINHRDIGYHPRRKYLCTSFR